MTRRDPACPCAHCNPPREPWSERWAAIVPTAAVAVAVVILTWTGRIF